MIKTILGTQVIHKIYDTLGKLAVKISYSWIIYEMKVKPPDWPHDTYLMRYENYSVVTEEIEVHGLRSFTSQFAQGIIYFMNNLGTEDGLKPNKIDFAVHRIKGHLELTLNI